MDGVIITNPDKPAGGGQAGRSVTDIPSSLRMKRRTKKIFATKTRRILFCYSFFESWCLGGEKKNFSQKAQSLQLKN
jgi:hypothetical protein